MNHRLLESLISQWLRCGSDRCNLKRCRRCRRGAALTHNRTQNEGNQT